MTMDPLNQQSRTRAKAEFQAIILSGIGSQLGPLVASHGDNPTPKALLPVLNKPLVSYGLSWLEEADIKEALIVCPPSHASALTDHIHATSPNLKVEIHAFEPKLNGPTSTIDILRKISGRIQSDFIVLSCDFVPASDLPLSNLLNLWRVDMTGMTMACLFYEDTEEAQKRKDKPLPTTTFKDSDILAVDYGSDNQVQLPMHLLTKFGKCRVTRQLADSHIYIFKRNVLDLLSMLPHLDSIKRDLIPLLCSLQYSRTKRREYSNVLVHPERLTTADNVQDKGSISILTALQYSTTQDLEVKTSGRTRTVTPTLRTKISWNNLPDSGEESTEAGSENEDPLLVPSLRCGLLVHRVSTESRCGRANTLAAYRELNQNLLRDGIFDPRTARDSIDPKAKVSTNSVWSASSRLGEDSTITHSVVGQHCVIGKNVKIVNSVIMEHVEIGDWVRIENCIISRHTKVGDKTELKDCESTPGAEIQGNSSYKGARLDGSEMMRPTPEDD